MVAILAVMGAAERQLASHAAAALRAGVSASELLALCEHVAVYAGFPRALNALTVVDKVPPLPALRGRRTASNRSGRPRHSGGATRRYRAGRVTRPRARTGLADVGAGDGQAGDRSAGLRL